MRGNPFAPLLNRPRKDKCNTVSMIKIQVVNGVAKSKYETHVLPRLKLVEAWARDGLTLDQIARNLSVSIATLHVYRAKHQEISDALKRGREEADVEVENALFKRAIGYRYDEVTYEPAIDPASGEPRMAESKRVTKEVHGDVTAQIYWLKNRRPEQWRDRRETTPDESEDNGNVDQLTEAIRNSAEQLKDKR